MATLTATAMPTITFTQELHQQVVFSSSSATFVDITNFIMTAIPDTSDLHMVWGNHGSAGSFSGEVRMVDSGASNTYLTCLSYTGQTASSVAKYGKGNQNSGGAIDIKGQIKVASGVGLQYFQVTSGCAAVNSGVDVLRVSNSSQNFNSPTPAKFSVKTAYVLAGGYTAPISALFGDVISYGGENNTMQPIVVDSVSDGGFALSTIGNVAMIAVIFFSGGTKLEVTA